MNANKCVLVAMMLAFCSTNSSLGSQGKPNETGPAYFRFGTAETFVNECKAVESADPDKMVVPTKDLNNIGLCYGFIAGVIDLDKMDSGFAKHPANGWCVPDDASDSQLARVILKYASDHPEELHFPSVAFVANALHRAFPC